MTDRAGNDGLSAAIRVPATPEALALVRLFATAIGRQADLAEADVEDLKLALTEVCSAAIEASAGDRRRDDGRGRLGCGPGRHRGARGLGIEVLDGRTGVE